MGNLTALEYLNLDANPLLPPFDALRREPYGDLAIVHFLDPFLSELDLTGCGFVELPTLLYRHAHYLLVRAWVRLSTQTSARGPAAIDHHHAAG